jgi:hypothetical protein
MSEGMGQKKTEAKKGKLASSWGYPTRIAEGSQSLRLAGSLG